MPGHPLEALVDLPGVAEAVARARSACETVRWHRALRRQWPVARTEAGVRCAWAGAAFDGVRVPLELVRDVARGAQEPPAGAAGDVVRGALRVQAAVERWMPAPGATGPGPGVPFAQLLAHLSTAVEGSGRPRAEEPPQDLRGLGPAPVGAELAARLAALGDLVALPLPPSVPALVRAAVVHGELMALRPFARGNAAVARAVLRLGLTRGAVDPVGVVVPEVAWLERPTVHLSAAAGFATGTPDGVAAWIRHCADAVVEGAREATALSDAVLAGRLGLTSELPEAQARDAQR